MKLKELKEKRAGAYAKLDELRKAAEGREFSAEERQQWDASTADYTKYDQQIADEQRFADIQRRQVADSTQNESGTESRGAEDNEYRSAFMEYLQHGANGVSPEARTLLSKRANLSGGLSAPVLIPSSMANQIEEALLAFGGMFEASTIIRTATGAELSMPTVNDTQAKATIVAEYGQTTKSSPTFGSIKLGAFTYRTPIVPISNELMQDSVFDIDKTVSGLLSTSFYRGANEHLTKGTGTGQPKGLVTAATACTSKAAVSGITFDDMLALYKEVDPAYSATGRWMFNQSTLIELMKIKNGDGQYIFNAAVSEGAKGAIWGRGYVINQDVDNIGAGKASVLFGALNKYHIRMVKDFSVLRLNELLAEYLSVGILGFGRLDGTLLDAGTNPVKKLIHVNS